MNHRYILNVFKQQQKSILSDDFIVTLEKLCCLYWLKIYEAAHKGGFFSIFVVVLICAVAGDLTPQHNQFHWSKFSRLF